MEPIPRSEEPFQIPADLRIGRRFILVIFIQRYGADDLVCGRMGIDHLLLLPDVFAECDETLCGESGISCADI